MDLPEMVNGLSMSDAINELVPETAANRLGSVTLENILVSSEADRNSSETTSHQHLLPEEAPIKKKTRRKPRSKPKNKLICDNLDCSILTDDFKIKSVKDETIGTVVHKRNIKCQKINLDTFINDTNTPLTVITRTNAVLPLENITTETPSKIARNKFKTAHIDSISESVPSDVTKSRPITKNTNFNNVDVPSKASTSTAILNNRTPKSKDHKKGNHITNHASPTTNSDLQSPKRHRNRRTSERTPEKQASTFENYYNEKTVDDGLKSGLLIEGTVRINPKFFTDAYISNVDRSVQDYIIGSVAERNRALEGDVVVIKIKPKDEWRDNQKKAEVVYIKEKVHPRVAVGFLSVLRDKDKLIATLSPRDKRVPRLNIAETSLPQNFFKNPKKYEDVLFMAQIIDWITPKYALGIITENVGKSNDLKAETSAILLENQLDFRPFPKSVEKYLPKSKEIPAGEFAYREDLRGECIFTIDPLTARDLDDAVSCKRLPNGNYEIGVHIADVSFHLQENTELDLLVSQKATTIYLVDNVYHMLPPQLCMHCSLLPGHDNLAFSVIWEMTADAEIVRTRFGRTIINSCTQFAYEHAQDIIDDPTAVLDPANYPKIHNGYNLEQIKTVVGDLQKIAVLLRDNRSANGALKINQIKLGFALDSKGDPEQYYVHAIKEANQLIEEFMLLANISVAKKIYADFPQLAFLRCHDEPIARLLVDVQKNLEVIGLHINVDSSGELHNSLEKYNSNDYLGFSRYTVLNHLLAKPMTRARYFCANSADPSSFYHYALSVPIYTHFTSPIRRYADVMVHRLLAASLGYGPVPKRSVDESSKIASNCNKQKYNAKKAGEASCDLYLAHFVEQHQPFIRDGVVVTVQEKSFDVIILETGSTVRLYTNNFDTNIRFSTEQYGESDKTLWRCLVIFLPTKNQPQVMQMIEMFQIVKVALRRKDKSHKLEGTLMRPSHIQISK